MQAGDARRLIERKYASAFGATQSTGYDDFLAVSGGAAVGYRRAKAEPLFLEAYLDDPVERSVSQAFGRTVERRAIIEIGNLASENALSLVELWAAAANDLGRSDEVVVATLTAPLRRMFARIGIPIRQLCPADPGRLGAAGKGWGSYYTLDPWVCAGEIGPGQKAIARFFARRLRKAAA